MSDFTHYVELEIPVRIEEWDGEHIAVIDLPEPVAAWIESQIGLTGMLAIQDEADAVMAEQCESQNACGQELRAEYREHEALRLADYGA